MLKKNRTQERWRCALTRIKSPSVCSVCVDKHSLGFRTWAQSQTHKHTQRERLEWVSQTLPPSRAHKQSPGRGEARQASGGARFMWRDRVFWVTAQCSHSPRQHHTESIKHDGWPIIIYLFGDFSMLSHSAKHVQEEGAGGRGGGVRLNETDVRGGKKKKQGTGKARTETKKNEWGKNDKMMLKED